MDNFVSIEVYGDEEVVAYLNRSAVRLAGGMRQATIDATHMVGEDAAVYPPETDANFPPVPYYIRGTGTQSSDERNRGESKQLGERWVESVTFSANETTGRVTNVATYAPHVQGRTMQTIVHQMRDWRTAGKILRDNVGKIKGIFNGAVHRALRG